jgi:reverse gyrase
MKSFETAGDFPTLISVIADLLPLFHKMNEAQLICIDDSDVVFYDFRPKNLAKKRKLPNVTADAEHEASECKKLKLTEGTSSTKKKKKKKKKKKNKKVEMDMRHLSLLLFTLRSGRQ